MDRMVQPEQNKRTGQEKMRRCLTRVGLGLLGYVGVSIWGFALLSRVVFRIAPQLSGDIVAVMTLNDVTTYGLGGLVLWLALRQMPGIKPRERSITSLRLAKLTLEAIGVMYTLSLFTSVLMLVFSNVTGERTGNLVNNLVGEMSIGSMLLFMVLIAPICEELLFRRLLFRKLLPMGERFAVVISALAFGLIHGNLYQFFYAVGIGLLFGCIVAKTGRIRYTILLHMLLNFLGSVVVVLITPHPMISRIYSLLTLAMMAGGIVVLLQDYKSLIPEEPSLPGSWKVALTTPVWLLCVIVLVIVSIVVVFLAA